MYSYKLEIINSKLVYLITGISYLKYFDNEIDASFYVDSINLLED